MPAHHWATLLESNKVFFVGAVPRSEAQWEECSGERGTDIRGERGRVLTSHKVHLDPGWHALSMPARSRGREDNGPCSVPGCKGEASSEVWAGERDRACTEHACALQRQVEPSVGGTGVLQVLQGSPCLSLSLSRSLALAFSHIRLSAHRGIVSCRRGTLFGVQFDDSSPVIYKTETSVRQMLVCDGEPAQMKQLELGLGLCALHPSDNVRYLEFSPFLCGPSRLMSNMSLSSWTLWRMCVLAAQTCGDRPSWTTLLLLSMPSTLRAESAYAPLRLRVRACVRVCAYCHAVVT